jgi:hypothetical protein
MEPAVCAIYYMAMFIKWGNTSKVLATTQPQQQQQQQWVMNRNKSNTIHLSVVPTRILANSSMPNLALPIGRRNPQY